MIKDTLYYQYIKERMSADIIENDKGFITFRVLGEECFVCDVFVEKKARRKSVFADLISELSEKAKRAGCKAITGRIHLNDNGKDTTLKAVLSLGFSLFRCEANSVIVLKEI